MSLENLFIITGFIVWYVFLLALGLFLIFMIYVVVEAWFERFYKKQGLWLKVLLGVIMNIKNKKSERVNIFGTEYIIRRVSRKR